MKVKNNIYFKLVKILIILTIVLTILVSKNTVKAYNSSSQEINNLKYNIQVNSDGSMDVEELWNIDVKYTNTLFKNFYIDKTQYSSITNCTVSELVNGVEEKLKDSGKYSYHVPTNEYYFLIQDGYYEVAWGTGLEYKKATKNYLIRYHVNDVIAKYNDCSELYWQACGSNFGIAIKKITGTIKLPFKATSKDEIKVWGHTPDLNGTIKVKDLDTVSFEVSNIQPKKMVELHVIMPTDMIKTSGKTYKTNELQQIISQETSLSNSSNTTRAIKILILIFILGIIFSWLIFVLIKNIIVINKNKRGKPTEHFDYYREIPNEYETPLLARMIIDDQYPKIKDNALGNILLATMLNLTLKKTLNFTKIDDQMGKDEYNITLQTNKMTAYTGEEHAVIELIEQASNGKNSITMKELKLYIKKNHKKMFSLKGSFEISGSRGLLENQIVKEETINKKKSSWFNETSYIISSIIIILYYFLPSIANNILNAIGISYNMKLFIILFIGIDWLIGTIADKKVSPYTQRGVDERDKWLAFKKYMEDFSMLDKREIPEIALWEKYLVYATAFGIADKVIRQLKVVYPQYYSDGNFMGNYIMMNMVLNTNFYTSFNSISTTTSMSFSSGIGLGGGFSLGGGGGGGRRF